MVSQEVEKIACPATLRRRLKVYRVGTPEEPRYLIRDGLLEQDHTFEPWQFFVLEVLSECKDTTKLEEAFQAQFSHVLGARELNELLTIIEERKWFSVSAVDHPLLIAFRETAMARSVNATRTATEDPVTPTRTRSSLGPSSNAETEPLPAGVVDVVGLDDARGKISIRLLDPRWLLKIVAPLAHPLRHAIYLLPLLLIVSFGIVVRRMGDLQSDLNLFRGKADLFEHLLFGMVTVNLFSTLAFALVAHNFRATVSGLCIVLHFGILPRFMARVGNVRQLTRREKIWLHATPLLVRSALLSVGVILWFSASRLSVLQVSMGLALTVASLISLLITANPLVKSSAYHLICAYLDQPYLRGKSYHALIGRLRGGTYQKADYNALVAYALASGLFMLLVVSGFFFLIGRSLRWHWGGPSMVLLAVVGAVLAWSMVGRFKSIGKVYERAAQFERWRKRTLPTGEAEPGAGKTGGAVSSYVGRALGLVMIAGMFIPYKYEPGGSFVLLPEKRQELSSPLAGLVEHVFYDGGEYLTRGTVIGRLSNTDDLAQVSILEAKLAEQKAVIAELKSKPLPEEVRVAESSLRTQETRARFSEEKLQRMEKLFTEDAVSLEAMEEMRRDHEVNIKQVEERRAHLELVMSGSTPELIAAAEARLVGLQEEHAYRAERVKQSTYVMPFDGTLVATFLKQKIGSYLDQRQPLALVENTDRVMVQVDIEVSDIGFVATGAPVRCRIAAYQEEEVVGVVYAIESTVSEERTEKVVRVTIQIDNQDRRLKSGMTGYAKIQSEVLPFWKAISLGIVRFFKIEVWSWLP